MKHRQPTALPPVRVSDRELLTTAILLTFGSAIAVIFVVFFLGPLLEALGL